ncbi:MAG: hypothetical protein JWP97_6066 [Labilithrix sp.]|nr:hypothetical protein [Labilithrix sp.]
MLASSRAARKRLAALVCGASGALAFVGSQAVLEGDARADVSSWLSAGGGYGFQHGAERGTYDRAGAVTFSIGVGSSPLSNVVVGGLLRTTTYVTLGTDLDLSLRVATGGFARGQWGVALDLGPGLRAWSEATNYGHWPLHAMAIGGAPWGLQVGIGADFFSLDGGPAARGAIALLEVDLLRLTSMRQGNTDKWWDNPSPAGGRAAHDTEQR